MPPGGALRFVGECGMVDVGQAYTAHKPCLGFSPHVAIHRFSKGFRRSSGVTEGSAPLTPGTGDVVGRTVGGCLNEVDLIVRSSGQFPRDRVEFGVFHRLFSTTDACDKVNDQTQRRAVIGPSALWAMGLSFSEDLVRSFNGGVCFSNSLPVPTSIDFVSGPETSVSNGVRVISGEQQALDR
jgi:hypothetical protein